MASGRINQFPYPASVPIASTVTVLSVTTDSGGSAYTTFASTVCDALDIVNNTGTTLEYRRGGAGSTIQLPSGSARLCVGISNANEISLRRTDVSTSQVTVTAEAIVL